MKHLIIEFVRLMREAGVSVTTMEAADCLTALELVGFRLELIKAVMETTLVKSMWELPIFNTLFDLFFDLAPDHQPDSSKDWTDPLIIRAGTADGSGRGSSGAGGDADGLLERIESQPPPVLEELARNFIMQVKLECASPQEISVKLRETQVGLRWFEAVNRVERRYLTGQIKESVFREWQNAFKLLEQSMRKELEKKAVRQFGRQAILPLVEFANIRRREFGELSLVEVGAIEQEITKLAKKLAEKPGIRLRRAKRGKVDLRRTFQEVVRTGGYPIRLKFRDRIKSKVDLWLFCDVSNSVEQFSRFMLQLVQAAQRRYAAVRSFVFIDEAVEVTEWFRHQDVKDFLEARHLRDRFSRRVGLSRYDLVLEQIVHSELSAISSKTKIIIFGDGRNNWRASGADELAKIGERAQAIYWLNPLPSDQWLQGDCLMKEYQPYCRQIFECRNLEQLTEVANRIL
ncbi:MAG TPA: VWA domain-containing protein [Methylomusa anaerophila]|uniref:VWA domain containing CoxE-like protein n=1 Tax=Methylomusa anaerophila TaxID=1930071 RepID=A0A348AF72_9FIRM|nr:VWA domain-containing protein [Methylomusa anaerophila]BBB89720.1 VWA domain containing CoxE-like protein [Methylomusa anaerophila]HML89235.1 VWA domain-containing protein [Methylomusa anaerophila]